MTQKTNANVIFLNSYNKVNKMIFTIPQRSYSINIDLNNEIRDFCKTCNILGY